MRLLALFCASCLGAPLFAQAPPPTAALRLVIESGGEPVTSEIAVRPGATLALAIRVVDTLRDSLPLSGFEAQVWDPAVMAVAGQEGGEGARHAVLRLLARARGQTTIQIRANGLRQWVRVRVTSSAPAAEPEVAPPVASDTTRPPLAPAAVPAVSPLPEIRPIPPVHWTAGGRFSAGLYGYSYQSNPLYDGQYGVVVEAYGGREWPSGVQLVAGLGYGILGADSAGRLVKPTLLEAYVRSDYAFLPHRRLRPVFSLGAGAYTVRTGNSGAGIRNTSLELLAGAGADVTIGPATVAELRVMTRQLFELNNGSANGYVGELWLLGAGLRARF